MRVELLFDRDDALCYEILQRLFHEHDQQITENRLIGDFDLTSYRLNKAVTTLNNDLMDMIKGDPVFLDEPEKGLLQAHNLSTLVIQRLALHYLARSVVFAVFEYHFIFANRFSKVDYMRSRYLSRTPFYHAEDQLEAVLPEFGLSMTEQPEQAEFSTRLKLFQIYYTIYNGLGDPFAQLNQEVSTLLTTLQQILNLNFTPTQTSKLSIFTKIWLARMRDRRALGKLPQSINTPDFSSKLQPLASIIKKTGDPAPVAMELNYYGLFLLTQGFMPDLLASEGAAFAPQAAKVADSFVGLVQKKAATTLSETEVTALHDACLTIQVQFSSVLSMSSQPRSSTAIR